MNGPGTNKHVALVMAKGPGRGKAAICFDGAYITTVDTYASTSTSTSRILMWDKRLVGTWNHAIKVPPRHVRGHVSTLTPCWGETTPSAVAHCMRCASAKGESRPWARTTPCIRACTQSGFHHRPDAVSRDVVEPVLARNMDPSDIRQEPPPAGLRPGASPKMPRGGHRDPFANAFPPRDGP